MSLPGRELVVLFSKGVVMRVLTGCLVHPEDLRNSVPIAELEKGEKNQGNGNRDPS